MTLRQKTKLTQHIEAWLRGKRIIKKRQTLFVTLRIGDTPPVVVDRAPDSPDDEEILAKALERIPDKNKRSRIKNTIENHGLFLHVMKTNSLDTMLAYRNLGVKSLRELRNALSQENVPCAWMPEFDRQHGVIDSAT